MSAKCFRILLDVSGCFALLLGGHIKILCGVRASKRGDLTHTAFRSCWRALAGACRRQEKFRRRLWTPLEELSRQNLGGDEAQHSLEKLVDEAGKKQCECTVKMMGWRELRGRSGARLGAEINSLFKLWP